MKYKTPFKHVSLVWWQDAYTSQDDDPHLEHKDTLTISMGVIVEDGTQMLHMSHFYDGISQTLQGPFTSIPKGMIKKIKHIKTGPTSDTP